MIPRSTFYKRLKQNKEQFCKDRKNGKRNFSCHKYVFADGSSFDPITDSDSIDDMVAAVCIGALPYRTVNGIDGIMWINGASVEVELKTCRIKSHHTWVGPRGGIYAGGSGKGKSKATLYSYISAAYNIRTHTNRRSKYVPTILVSIDYTTGAIIDAHFLKASGVRFLFRAKKKRGSMIKGLLTIKLSSFIKLGWALKTVIPKIGIEQYKELLSEFCDPNYFGPSNNFDQKGYKAAVNKIT